MGAITIATGSRDGVRGLPALAARRASLRRRGPLPGRRRAHRDDRRQPLRRRRGAAHRDLPALSRRRAGTPPPAFVIGMGFALKITPLALLPLVLLLAGPPRRWAWPLVAFGAAAVAPFLPYVLKSWSGVWYVFQYHLERPLQIESVLGTPQLLGQLLGADWATWAWSHGSHSLIAPGVGLAADMSGGLTLLAVAAVYLFVWLRRERLRAAPRRPGARRAGAAARAHDVRQGALARSTSSGSCRPGRSSPPATAGSRSWAASRSRSPRRSSPRSTGTCSTCSRRRSPSSSRATRCCWRRSWSRCGGCGGCRRRVQGSLEQPQGRSDGANGRVTLDG